MQVFLPYPSFIASSIVLDPRRRHKQILENAQIIRAATEPGAPWANHCVTRAWAPYTDALAEYTIILTGADPYHTANIDAWWFDYYPFHRGHRGHLYRKDPVFYVRFAEDKDFPLLYPTMTEGVFAERVDLGRFRRWGQPGARIVRRVQDVLK